MMADKIKFHLDESVERAIADGLRRVHLIPNPKGPGYRNKAPAPRVTPPPRDVPEILHHYHYQLVN